jgi:hypothetical protein
MSLLLQSARRQPQNFITTFIARSSQLMPNYVCSHSFVGSVSLSRVPHISQTRVFSSVASGKQSPVVDEGKIQDINERLDDALKNKSYDILVTTLDRAIYNNVEFNASQYGSILRMLAENQRSHQYDFSILKAVYDKIAKKSLNFEVFKNMLTLCQHANEYQVVLEVNKEFESVVAHNSASLSYLIRTLVKCNSMDKSMIFYKRYISYMRDNTALNARAVAQYEASVAQHETSVAVANNTSSEGGTPQVTIRPPSLPLKLPSNWAPLKADVHLDLVRLLLRNNNRLVAMETLLDFAEANDRHSALKRSKEATRRASMTSESASEREGEGGKEGEEGEEDFPPASFVTSILVSKHVKTNMSSRLLQLLEDVLVLYNAPLARIILSWLVEASEYQQQYLEFQKKKNNKKDIDGVVSKRALYFPRGLLLRCFQLGGAMGDPEIADLTKDLCDLTGVSLGKEEYTQMFIAYCRGNDVQSTIRTMIVAEASGIDICNVAPPSKNQGVSNASKGVSLKPSEVSVLLPRYIQFSLSQMLRKLEESDRLYFTLAELVEADMQPPVAALNSLIIAQGNLNQLDRSFSVMQEFETVFNTKPNEHTYHALLEAIAKSRLPRVDNSLHIMSDMDDAGYPPDAGCFSLLLQTMMKCNDTEGAIGILEHLRSSAVIAPPSPSAGSGSGSGAAAGGEDSSESERQVETMDFSHWPSYRTLRQLAIYFAKRGRTDQFDLVEKMMRDVSPVMTLPLFYRQRVARLAKLGVLVNDDDYE